MTHTSGTWQLRDPLHNLSAPQIGQGKLLIATAHYGAGIDHVESLANARLITASPELLDACKSALLALEWAKTLEPKKQLLYDRAQEQVRTAIAKAEGREP